MRGRRPAGPEYVQQLTGSATAKERLQVVLQTLAGQLGVQTACARLGIGPQRFHQLRQQVLQAALADLEPGHAGRPARPADPAAAQVRALQEQVRQQEVELHAAQAREEIAVILPRVAHPPVAGPAKKKAPPRGTPAAPAAWDEGEHMKRLTEVCPAPAAGHAAVRPRLAWQQPRRRREQQLRGRLVELCTWTAALGLSAAQAAALLGLAPRTLRQWQFHAGHGLFLPPPLGRPVLRSPRADRQEVLELLDELGPATGVPLLRQCFPHLPRAELTDLLRRYRQLWRRHGFAAHVLHWRVPGVAWAADFAEPPAPLDGLYPYLLAVRDLGSGQQLLWLPVAAATADTVWAALLPLFLVQGAPLVLKSDNGAPFTAALVQRLLGGFGVLPLFSPPYRPQYNGAIEAGIGALKSRTERQATAHGRPGQWTWDDAAAAQAEANATARPQGPTGPTPDERWAARRRLTALDRSLFRAGVLEQQAEVRVKEGWPAAGPLSGKQAQILERQAIRRALEKHGYLHYTRRRIPLPITKPKAARIT